MSEITLSPADREGIRWAVEQVVENHYLHTAPDPRSRPFVYLVSLGGRPVGCLFFGRTQAPRCFRGSLTYGGAEDIRAGRAAFDRWEILDLSRVWFTPDVQVGGRWYTPDHLPGFVDRRGTFRSTVASTVIGMALARVGADYLLARPPVWVDSPYAIRVVSSYCDTRVHRGVIYRAAGFRLSKPNDGPVETWWTDGVGALTDSQHRAVREASELNPRSRRVREASRTLFPVEGLR